MSTLLPPPLALQAVLASRPPKLDFVLPGLVAGHVGAIVAPGSTGKSFLVLQIAVGIAAAAPIADDAFPAPTTPRRVVMLAAEDDANILAMRLHAIVDRLTEQDDGDGTLFPEIDRTALVETLQRNLVIHSLHGRTPSLVAEPDAPSLADELGAHCSGARLVVIDPLRRFHAGDENDSGVMTRLVQNLERVARDSGAAVLLAHHTNKSSVLNGLGDLQQAVRGSSALTDAIRWQVNMMAMTTKEADEFGVEARERRFLVRLEVTKSNYVPPQPSVWLRRLPNGPMKRIVIGAVPAVRKGARHGH